MKKVLLLSVLLVLVVLAFFGCTETPKLLTPGNLTISKTGLASWDAVDNATEYVVSFRDSSYVVTDAFFKVSDLSSDFTLSVVARADGFEDSDPASASYAATVVPDDVVPDDAVLSARSQRVTVNDDEFDRYDFTALFSLKNEERIFPVKAEYLDMSHLSKTEGGYVVCRVGERTAQVDVLIHKRVYHLTLSTQSVIFHADEAVQQDYSRYFHASVDGNSVTITNDMVTSTVQNKAGSYTFSVTFHGQTQTLNVNVIDRISITAGRKSLTLNDYELDGYDFASLFAMTVNGKRVTVTDDYVDLSRLKVGGTGDVICSNGEGSASISVTVVKNVYEIFLKQDVKTVHTSIAADYDYLSLFTAKHNGKDLPLDKSMTASDVKAVAGRYSFTVTVRDVSKTLTVVVTDEHQVELVPNYNGLEIALADVADFDYTCLFALYVDEAPVKVTADMVDSSALTGDAAEVSVGKSYVVSATYGANKASSSTTVKVVETPAVAIVARNVTVYVNATPVDLASLFEVTRGVQVIPVTRDMLSGSVDYSVAGDYAITLSYGSKEATATVTVKRGVVIGVRADEIIILKGTDKERYFFEDDFTVTVNGVAIVNITPFIDVSSVDFNTVGDYQVTISVPYNDQGFSPTISDGNNPSSAYEPQYVTATVTYKVVERVSRVTVNNESLTVGLDSATFNPLSNLTVTVNNARQTLVTDKSLANVANCYVKVVQTIDATQVGAQTVRLDVYADGVDADPVSVQYVVYVRSTAKLTARDAVIFVGDTLYNRDLFTIDDNGTAIEVTSAMLNGHVDAFTPGMYSVTLTYRGATATARVAVFEQSARGVYATYITTIASTSDVDEEGDVIGEDIPSRRYGNLVFASGTDITMDGMTVTVRQIVDEHTLIVNVGSTPFTMHLFDGIIVLDPDNSHKLSFTNFRRPFVYFNQSVWNLDLDNGKLIVNYGADHVLADTNPSYTIEVYTVTSKTAPDVTRRLALYVNLVNKNSSDTIYLVTWGEPTLSDGFTQTNGETGILTYDGETYSFTMHGPVTGKVLRNDDLNKNYPYAGRYKDYKNGSNATLNISSNGDVTYNTGSRSYSVKAYELGQLKNGGLGLDKQVFIYRTGEDESSWFSFKFTLDTDAKTFRLLDKDALYGYYVLDDKYVFLDGYGTGLVSFDTSSYVTLQCRYAYDPATGEVVLTFFNNHAYPQYGSGATFYLLNTLNVLVVKDAYDSALSDRQFCNTHIIDGAIVRFDSVNVCGTPRDDIRNAVTVITKDGELTAAQKKDVVDVRAVDINRSGVFQVSVKVSVGGQTLTCYYAVQAFTPLSGGAPLAGVYGSSAMYGTACSLTVDRYGLATLVFDGSAYRGNVAYYGTDRFVVRAKSASNVNVVITGQYVADGILYVTSRGAVNFFDYMTVGSVTSAGDGTYFLRKITVNNVDTYVWAYTSSSSGDVADVTVLADNRYSVSVGGSVVAVVQIDQWGNLSSGMRMSDIVRGSYSDGDGKSLVLDGFGAATLNDASYSYVINANGTVTLVSGDDVVVCRLDKSASTYQILPIALDNTLLQGKTFVAQYVFVCDGAPYTASTNFVFGRDGTVSVTSRSTEHDSGEDQCTSDIYSPPFVSGAVQYGKYQVKGNKVTLTFTNANGTFTFVFEILDVTVANRIMCLSTNVESDAHGYFGVGTVFFGVVTG